MPWLEDLKFPRGYQMGTHKEKKDKTFNKIEYGNEQILSYYHKDIYHLISKNLI